MSELFCNRIFLASFSLVEVFDVFLNILIKLVEVDISQYGANDTTLRSSAV